MVVREGDNSNRLSRWSLVRDHITENTVRQTKYGRIRRMAVGEGGRSTGVLLYCQLL